MIALSRTCFEGQRVRAMIVALASIIIALLLIRLAGTALEGEVLASLGCLVGILGTFGASYLLWEMVRVVSALLVERRRLESATQRLRDLQRALEDRIELLENGPLFGEPCGKRPSFSSLHGSGGAAERKSEEHRAVAEARAAGLKAQDLKAQELTAAMDEGADFSANAPNRPNAAVEAPRPTLILERRLREEFRDRFLDRDFASALAVGQRILASCPNSILALDFRKIEPHLLRLAGSPAPMEKEAMSLAGA